MSFRIPYFKDLALKWKFTVISVGVTLGVLLMVSGLFFAAEVGSARSRLMQEVALEAEVTGNNCAAPLLFGDPATAKEILDAMRLREDVVHAVVYDAAGMEFAAFVREGHKVNVLEKGTPSAEAVFTPEGVAVYRQIAMDGQKVGTVYIEMGLASYYAGLRRIVLTLAVGLALALPVAFILSLRLQGLFTAPISNLMNAAKAVSESKDYSVRVAETSGDELGVLITVFNEMLAQIEHREARLRMHADELEAEVRKRTGELTEANSQLVEELAERKKVEEKLIAAREAAEEATRLKDKFVSLVSHDLRSPIASNVSGMRALLSGVMGGEPEEAHRKIIKALIGSNESLIEMIDRLLDVSRLKTGQLRPKRRFFRPHYKVAEVFNRLSGLAELKNIRLVNDVPSGLRLFADIPLFGEVLINLVSNAIKFTPPGGTITVFSPEGRTECVAVRDTGVGIPPSLLPDLFKHEVKTTTAGTAGESGTGLGLPFCRDIMEAHGGMICAESGTDGSVFFVELPPVRVVVLVVDDQEAVRISVVKHLAWLGISVLEAENGAEAMRLIEESRPHLVITDINMPVMDGFELLRRMRAIPAFAEVPVIVVTSLGEAGVKEKAFAMGASDFVNKPVIAEDFVPRVRRFIG